MGDACVGDPEALASCSVYHLSQEVTTTYHTHEYRIKLTATWKGLEREVRVRVRV